MTAWRPLPLLLAAAFAGVPAAAQPSQEERARIEDFAVPPSAEGLRVDQLDSDAEALPAAVQQSDRTLARPPAPEPGGTMPAQLSDGSSSDAPVQVSAATDSRIVRSAGVSSTADSAPRATAPLKGRDRCDPQLAQRVYAECLRILELRADEFSAPEAPRLSAEQALLAEQRAREEEMSGTSPALRLRFATKNDPDADLRSNQELAAIYLATPAAPPAPEPEKPVPDEAASLGEILQGLGLPPGSTPPQ